MDNRKRPKFKSSKGSGMARRCQVTPPLCAWAMWHPAGATTSVTRPLTQVFTHNALMHCALMEPVVPPAVLLTQVFTVRV